jgi:hypothetical protein
MLRILTMKPELKIALKLKGKQSGDNLEFFWPKTKKLPWSVFEKKIDSFPSTFARI